MFAAPAPAMAGAMAATAELSLPAFWHWLAPTMAAFVVGLFAMGKTVPNLTGFEGLSSTSLVATVAFDQPSLATYSDTAHHSDANTICATGLPWVPAGGATVVAPQPVAITNRLF